MKNTHWGEILLKKSQALAWNFSKSNTPLWVFLHVILLSLLIIRRQSAYFLNCMNCFKWRKALYVRYWSKQWTLEVSVVATELVSNVILFLILFSSEAKISIHFIDICSKLYYFAYFLNCMQASFHVVVWPRRLMLHNFVPALACFLIFMSLPFDHHW